MSHDLREATTTERHERSPWSPFKVPLVAGLAALMLFAALSAVEHTTGSTTVQGTPVVNRTAVDSFFASLPNGTPGTTAEIAAAARQMAGSLASPEAGVAAAGTAADTAGNAINAASAPLASAGAARRLTAPTDPAVAAALPAGVFGGACGSLLSAEARVDTTFGAIIGRYPFLGGRLGSVEAGIDARFSVLLGRFGCGVSGGI